MKIPYFPTILILFLVNACSSDIQSGNGDGGRPRDAGVLVDAEIKTPDEDANVDPSLCGGDCRDIEYTACTCGTDDPCSWAEDGFCDDECDLFLPIFDDSIDCTADCGSEVCSSEFVAQGQPGPEAIVVDTTHVYYIRTGSSDIVRVAKVGGPLDVLASAQTEIRGLAQDSSHLYWTTVNAVRRVSKSGGGTVETLVGSQPLSGPHAIAVNNTHVYWTNSRDDTISRILKSGGSPETIVTGQDFPKHIAVDSGRVYWSAILDQTVMSSTLNGGDLQTIAANVSADDIEIDDSHVYWITDSSILRRSKSGGGVETIIDDGNLTIDSIAVDDTHIYFTETSLDTVSRVQKDGGGGLLDLDFSQDPGPITLDDSYIYWTTNFGDVLKLSRCACDL